MRNDWLDRVERSRQQSAAFVSAAVDAFRIRGPKFQISPRTVPSKAREPYVSINLLDDPTLRAGDVVAVGNKLVVFRGGPHAPHAPDDFEDLRQTGAVSGTHDNELRALDRALASETSADITSSADASGRLSVR